jgi:acyl-homoserine lactone acylase PvdQ
LWVTANNRPDRPGGAHISTLAQPPYRRDRIRELLGEAGPLDVAACRRAQYDLVSLQARRLCPLLVPFLPDGEMKGALARLDHRYDAGAREPTMFENLYEEALRAVFCRGPWGSWLARALERTALLPLLFGFLDDVLARDDSSWLPAAERADALREAGRRAAARYAEPWGERHALTMKHLVFGGGALGQVGLDRGPIAWDGGRATVRQASLFYEGGRLTSFGPCYHFVTALADAASWTNTPAGASERPWSRYYANDLDRWLSGEYRELRPDAAVTVECQLEPT